MGLLPYSYCSSGVLVSFLYSSNSKNSFLNLSQGNSCCFLLFTFQTLFTDLADCSCRCNQYHLRICRVTYLVIQAACTHRFTDDCIRTICHITDLPKSFIRYFYLPEFCFIPFDVYSIIQLMGYNILTLFFISIHQKRKSTTVNFLFSSSIIHPFQHFQINLKLPVTISYPGNYRYPR